MQCVGMYGSSPTKPMSLRRCQRHVVGNVLGWNLDRVGVYAFQTQGAGSTICARCAINNLAQMELVTDSQMNELNQMLNAVGVMVSQIRQGGGWGIDEIKAVFNGIANTDIEPKPTNDARFGVAVELAIHDNARTVDALIQRADFQGVILHRGWHWIAVRKDGDTFVLCDSMTLGPVEIPPPKKEFFNSYSNEAVMVFQTSEGVAAYRSMQKKRVACPSDTSKSKQQKTHEPIVHDLT